MALGTQIAVDGMLLALPQVPGALVFLLCLVCPVALLGSGAYALTVPKLGRGYLTVAVLPLLLAAVLAAYVFGEDSYRANGISRWDAYRSPGGALGELFVLTIVVLIGCSAALGYAARRDRRWLFAASALATAFGAAFLVFATFIGFSSN